MDRSSGGRDIDELERRPAAETSRGYTLLHLPQRNRATSLLAPGVWPRRGCRRGKERRPGRGAAAGSSDAPAGPCAGRANQAVGTAATLPGTRGAVYPESC